MKNALALLAAVGLVVTVAVFANRNGADRSSTADQSTTAGPAADVPAQQVQADEGCCGLEGLLGAPVGKLAPVAAEAAPAAAAASGDECGAACPSAMLSGTCCMELAGAAAKVEQAHTCCAEGAEGAAAATACEHSAGTACCEECVTAPQAAPAKQKDQ